MDMGNVVNEPPLNKGFRDAFMDVFESSKKEVKIISPDMEKLYKSIGPSESQDILNGGKHIQFYTTEETKPNIRNVASLFHDVFVGLEKPRNYYIISDDEFRKYLQWNYHEDGKIEATMNSEESFAITMSFLYKEVKTPSEIFQLLLNGKNVHKHELDKKLDPIYKLTHKE